MTYRIPRTGSLFLIWILAILLFSSQSMKANDSIQSLFEQARSLKSRGEYAKAIEFYQQILKEDPENYQAIRELAQVYSWNKEYDRSIQYYDILLGKSLTDYDALLGKAQVLGWAGEYDMAEDLYSKVIEAVPDYLDAYLGLANVCLWTGKYHQALGLLRKLEEEDPENQEIIRKIFDIYYVSGDFKSAREYYQKIIKLDEEYEAGPEVTADLCLYTIYSGYLYERLDVRDDWESSYLTISYRPEQKFTLVLSVNWLNRFGKTDRNVGLAFYTDITSSLNAYLGLTLSPEPDFSPSQRYDLDLVLKAKRGTSFLAGLDYLIFDEGVVQVYALGFEHYPSGRIYFSYQLFHSQDYDGLTSDSHLLKLNFSREKSYLYTFGYATGSEAFLVESREEVMNVESKTFFLILKRWFDPRWGMNINASYTDRKDSYLKRAIGVGLFLKF
jgi:YaiO family outer membrane protein